MRRHRPPLAGHDGINLGALARGTVRVWNGLGHAVVGKNLVTYQGGDVVAGLLAGRADYKISQFYFLFSNVPYSAPAPTRGDNAADIHGLTGDQDFLRAPLVSTPVLTASDANHQGNRGSYFSICTSTVGLAHALPYGPGSSSEVYALGLVASPNPSDYLADLLYAYFVLPAPVPAGGGQISASWLTEVQ